MICSFLLFGSLKEIAAQKNQLKFYSASGGIGYYDSFLSSSIGGLNFNLDISTILSEDIFSLYFSTGFSEQIIIEENYTELNITYGRALKLGQRLWMEGHFGLGYIVQKSNTPAFDIDGYDYVEYNVGFPLRAKILYSFNENMGLGINPNINLNGIETFYSINLIFQYRF